MALYDIVFYIFAVIVVGSGLIVVLSKNIMYSAFSLLFTFFGVAGLYVLLNSDFLAVAQILVYIGGILILIIFGVMLTSKITGIDIKTGVAGKFQIGFAGIACLALFIFLVLTFTNANWVTGKLSQPESTIGAMGVSLMTDYLIAFEAVSVLLLIALVGAALIARRK